MRMEELTMMVDLAGQVGILLAGGLEYDLYQPSVTKFPQSCCPFPSTTHTLEPLVSLCDAR